MGLCTETVQNYLAKTTKATNSLTSADNWSFLGIIKYRSCPMWYKRRRQKDEKNHISKKLKRIYRPSVGFTGWKYNSKMLGNMTWKFDVVCHIQEENLILIKNYPLNLVSIFRFSSYVESGIFFSKELAKLREFCSFASLISSNWCLVFSVLRLTAASTGL